LQPIPSHATSEPPLDDRALAALAKQRNFSTDAVRLLLRAKETILLAMGLTLAQWRDSRDPVSGAFAEHCEAEIKCSELREAIAIIRGRIERIPAAHSKRYSPEERFRIVTFKRTYHLTLAETAELFMVDAQTISRWMDEATRDPDAKTIGSLLKATPPMRTTSDVTRELVSLLDSLRVGGSKSIAQMLVRAGKTISRETVRRIRKTRPSPQPAPERDDRSSERAVQARAANHVWMTDLTTIPSLFRLWSFKLCVVIDVYSRFPLTWRLFKSEPSSEELATLIGEAADKFGKPTHFITDRGSQFTAATFTTKLAALGTKQRFGAIGQSGSIAIIERFWRTLKELLDVRFKPPLSFDHLEQRLTVAIDYYATRRPHQGLDGATPAEKYFGLSPPQLLPASDDHPYRDGTLPFTVAWADHDRRMPYLVATTRAA
jgi:putative transposase